MIDFSIIIPVFNVENYLPTAVRSVLNQDYGSFEIILVDDCSTDSSGEICDKYAEQDNRIKVIHKAKNAFVGAARNDGLKAASGRYVYFLDSDDRMCEDVLKKVSPILSASPDVICSLCHCTIKGNGKIQMHGAFIEGNSLKASIAAFSPFVGQSFYSRNFLIDNNKPFDEHRMLAEDRKWIVENLATAKSIHAENIPFYYYTQRREGSLLNLIRADSLEYSLKEMKKLYDGIDKMSYGKNYRLKRKLADHYLTLASCAAIVKDDQLRNKLLASVNEDIYILKSRDCLAHCFMWLRYFIGLKNLLRICNAVFLRYETDK